MHTVPPRLDTLPDELKLQILHAVAPADIARMESVSRSWRALARDYWERVGPGIMHRATTSWEDKRNAMCARQLRVDALMPTTLKASQRVRRTKQLGIMARHAFERGDSATALIAFHCMGDAALAPQHAATLALCMYSTQQCALGGQLAVRMVTADKENWPDAVILWDDTTPQSTVDGLLKGWQPSDEELERFIEVAREARASRLLARLTQNVALPDNLRLTYMKAAVDIDALQALKQLSVASGFSDQQKWLRCAASNGSIEVARFFFDALSPDLQQNNLHELCRAAIRTQRRDVLDDLLARMGRDTMVEALGRGLCQLLDDWHETHNGREWNTSDATGVVGQFVVDYCKTSDLEQVIRNNAETITACIPERTEALGVLVMHLLRTGSMPPLTNGMAHGLFHCYPMPELLQLLLDLGADPTKRVEIDEDEDRRTWLGHAVNRCNFKAVEVLLQHPTVGRSQPLVNWWTVFSQQSDDYLTEPRVLTMSALLRHGADPDEYIDGRPLLIDLMRHENDRNLQLMRCLLRGGADPNALSYTGRTALHVAKKPETRALLLAFGANPNAVASDWKTAEPNMRLGRLLSVEKTRIFPEEEWGYGGGPPRSDEDSEADDLTDSLDVWGYDSESEDEPAEIGVTTTAARPQSISSRRVEDQQYR